MNHLYITGVDGCGKTTQLDLLESCWKRLGIRHHRVWLRYPALTSAPLLAYARIAGYTRYVRSDLGRVGMWMFQRSWILRSVFPWLQLVDLALLSSVRVLPAVLLRKRILFERFALDVLVDLIVATGREGLAQAPVGRALRSFVPPNTRCILLDVTSEEARTRRTSLWADSALEARARAYHQLADDGVFITVSGVADTDHVARSISRIVEDGVAELACR